MKKYIKSIETEYNGYKFRSRLEARWGIFFDALGIKWIYEPEGFDLGDGVYYLPDFYLPEMDAYFEVKGVLNWEDITDDDKTKIKRLAKLKKFAIGYSDMTFECIDIFYTFDECGNKLPDYSLNHNKNECYICRCPNCEKYTFLAECGCWHCWCCDTYGGEDLNADRELTGDDATYSEIFKYGKDYPCVQALIKARQVRFEHGAKLRI